MLVGVEVSHVFHAPLLIVDVHFKWLVVFDKLVVCCDFGVVYPQWVLVLEIRVIR